MTLADELLTTLRQAGLEPTGFGAAALDRVPLSEGDRALLAGCGLPDRGQPGYLWFARPEPVDGPRRLRTLAEEYPKLRESPRAQARTLLAKDGSGNLVWIDTAADHAVVFFDHDEGRPAQTNRDLAAFLRCLAAYHRFLGEHGDLAGGWPAAGLAPELLRALRDTLRQIDPLAVASRQTLWASVFEGRLPAEDGG